MFSLAAPIFLPLFPRINPLLGRLFVKDFEIDQDDDKMRFKEDDGQQVSVSQQDQMMSNSLGLYLQCAGQ
ncbi:hypothetical protein RRG08_038999 [Elysia crispata]|uniref:Uncharacterized protein n=1 Tax=Elysia crispata TaxID=231223 RepID=A0AAE1CTQ2_9GAST|nr:hypothetical protein RRG08_038999 [Elysia crispata]